MAKKKSTNNSKNTFKKQTNTAPKKDTIKKVDSMQKKVEVKKSPDGDKASRVVGTIFIGLGVLLVAFGVYSFIQFRSDPTYDETYVVPEIGSVTEITSGNEVMIKGETDEYDTIAVFINDEKVGETKVKDGVYEYVYETSEDGEYSISIAGLKGFPIRKVSARSTELVAVVDNSAPSTDSVELVYGEETNKDYFKLTGSVESYATVEVKRGVDIYTAIADEDGYFEITEISLDEGKNVFNISLSDRAGNTVSLDEKIRVEYSPEGNVNGDAVADQYSEDMGRDVAGTTDLPQAAGELDNLIVRYLMIIFGLSAIFVFSGSSIYALNKRK